MFWGMVPKHNVQVPVVPIFRLGLLLCADVIDTQVAGEIVHVANHLPKYQYDIQSGYQVDRVARR
jgi:hypothetical protein